MCHLTDEEIVHEQRIAEQLGKKFLKPLSVSQILAAFPDEARILVKPTIYNLERELKFYLDNWKMLMLDENDGEFSKFQAKVEQEIYMPKDKMKRYADLKVMERLMCKTLRGTTDEDIAKAKEVDIWTMHEFRNKRGKSACCPFHNDMIASFAVRGNKWICFAGCGKGDSIDFYMKLNNVPFYKAVEECLKLK